MDNQLKQKITSGYNVAMFAYNEEKTIKDCVESVINNSDENLQTFFVLANGCSDNTVPILKSLEKEHRKLKTIEIKLGDKCNAWNTYIHEYADDSTTHFFVDADVEFSKNCFPLMHERLLNTEEETVTVAGMPLSGRNIEFYRSLVVERACFFGGLYGLKLSFIKRIQETGFYLPIGLNWIDSFLTKAVNTDLNFFDYNLPNRTTYIEDAGYHFESLSPFRKDDVKLYINRIARYELGKLQETYLDNIPVKEWPRDLIDINKDIMSNFESKSKHLGLIKKHLVLKRLKKYLAQSNN